MASILRRTAPVAAPMTPQTVRFGQSVFHIERGELRQGDATVRLTERERFMLQLLARTPGEPVTREALAGAMPGNERTVDVQINRLRRKIERDPPIPFICKRRVVRVIAS